MVVTDKTNISAVEATPATTRQWVIKAFPPVSGEINLDETFELKTMPLWGSENKPTEDQQQGGAAGKLLLKMLVFSNDPAQRTWIVDKPAREHYRAPIKIGEVMKSYGIGEVIESFHANYTKGELVSGLFGWSQYILVNVEDGPGAPRKLPPKTDPSEFIAVGGTALTAYFGLLNIGGVTAKDKTVVISAAAGATGSSAVQIAKHVIGVEKVYGIAGSPEKCRLVEELGADKCFNYKDPAWKEQLSDAVWKERDGIDCYFDNVAGEILDLCLRKMNRNGRVVACGAIAGYNSDAGGLTPEGWRQIIFKKLRVQGFIFSDYLSEFAKANSDLSNWVLQGKLRPLKTVWKAKFEEVPQAMRMLLEGKNEGKLVTQIIES